jgi:DNA-binding transcriptional regulator GbsR (MarR family)
MLSTHTRAGALPSLLQLYPLSAQRFGDFQRVPSASRIAAVPSCFNPVNTVYSVIPEMTEATTKLSPIEQRFILHWGEMGTRWGINRTVAQVHALLFVSHKPLHAEEIANTLAVARSNVSNSLRELQGWGIVRIAHVLGDRRDHFESVKDVWEIFRIVSQERKRREIDPTLRVLEECVGELKKAGAGNAYVRERLQEMLEFLTTTSGLFEEFVSIPSGALKGMARLRGKLKLLLGVGKKPKVK